MDELGIRDYEYTSAAWESLYDAVDDDRFREQDAEIIYESLKTRLKIKSFGDYLKRYIYLKAEFAKPFVDVSVSEYQEIIQMSFADNNTPPSFTPTTAKLSALAKNWLTQQSVKRKIVFLQKFRFTIYINTIGQHLKGIKRNPNWKYES